VVEVSFLASFLGGLLSLLSPCSALLLPAFFAYAFQSRGVLVGRTAVFYLGLCATLVPLGMGISAISSLVYGHRSTLITVSGIVIIAFGVIQAVGGGFAFGPIERLRGRIKGSSLLATFSLGAVYGFAGFCSGPILGAVLTVAATSGSALRGAGLLATYAAGMAAPLFIMALLWDRLDLGRRRWMRGREISWRAPLAHDQPPLWPDVRRYRGPVYRLRRHLRPRRLVRLGRCDGARLLRGAMGGDLHREHTGVRGTRGSRLAVRRIPPLRTLATPQEEACGAWRIGCFHGGTLAVE
jgi:cytochrome c biogenesis protein CcdA